MPHVLLLFEFPTLNGGEHSLLSLLSELTRAGYRLTAGAPSTGPLAAALTRANVALLPLDLTRDSSQIDRRREVAQLIQQVRPDLVHANSVSMSRLAGPVCRQLGVPSIGHLRDMLRLSARALGDIQQNERLLAVSHATAQWFERLGVSSRRLHVMYNGVDLDEFRPRAPTKYLHEHLGLSPDVALLGSIGQLGMRKGLDVLLQAAEGVGDLCPEPHFLIVGQRHSAKEEAVEYERSLHRFAAAKLPGRVHFLGRRDDVGRLLAELSILVHLARQEPLGRVLLEAAAVGCCILTTAVGGTGEIFPADLEAACLIPPDEPSTASAAMHRLLNNASLRRQLGDAARQRAEFAFSVRHASRQLLRHYNDVLSS